MKHTRALFKKSISLFVRLLLSLCMLCGLFTAAAGAAEAPFYNAASGEALTIVTAAAPTESEKTAAETLQRYLEEVTGKRPAIAAAAPETGAVISLAVSEQLASQPKGSYRLRWGADAEQKPTDDPVFYIEAADARGLFNGVYGFLSRVCGVEIYSANVKTVPESETLAAESPYFYAYVPTLEYADTDWVSPHDLEFAVANGLNGIYSPVEPLYGGKVNYIWFCHSLTNGIVPEGEFFESHPEYYALQEDGTRQPTQLCLSNPAVVEQAKKDVRKQVEESYNPDAALNIVSVTQDDNYLYCRCENCAALAEQYGGQSGIMLWFVNRIAEDIDKDYPDLVVDTFAYQYTRQAPQNIVPRENVCVRLCSIECCFAHALDDPNCEDNVNFMKDLQDWSRICNRMYVWDYVTNFLQTLCVFPNFGVLRENIDTFRENHVVGIYEEGAYYADPAAVEFYDLRAFMLSRLMRDTLTAEEELAVRNGFLKAYYGGEEGGAAVGEIVDILTAHAGNEEGHLHIYDAARYSLHGMTDDVVARVNELWKIALDAAAGDADAVTRIENSRLAWRYYEACAGKGEFKGIFGLVNVSETKKLISDLQAAGVTRYNEGKFMQDLHLSPIVSPADWGETDSAVVPPALITAAVTVLLCLAAAVLAFVNRRKLCGALLLCLTAAAVPLGAVASDLFIRWENLALYGFVDALMLLTVAGFILIAAWAKNGCAFPKGKKAGLTVFLSLLICALPYELTVLVINTLIYHGLRPLFSITLSAFVQIAIVAVSAVIVILSFLRKRGVGKK